MEDPWEWRKQFFPSGTNKTQHDKVRKNTLQFLFICNAAIIPDLQLHITLPASELFAIVWVSYIKKNPNRHKVGAEQQPPAPPAQTDTRTVTPAALVLAEQGLLKLLRSQLILMPVQRCWMPHLTSLHGKGLQHKGAVALAFRHP